MDSRNEKTIKALNGLIRINNDRVEGYRTAAKESDSPDLDAIFNDFIMKSERYAIKLEEFVRTLGGEPADGDTFPGDIYRFWMDIKKALASKERLAILSSCEYGEDVALKSYKKFLEMDELNLTDEMKNEVIAQKDEVQLAHNKIKEMRDAEKEAVKA